MSITTKLPIKRDKTAAEKKLEEALEKRGLKPGKNPKGKKK
jgi:hypothetical protein